MEYIVDIILILIFAAVVASSAKRGFFRSLIDLAGSIVAFVAARLFSQSIAPEIYESYVAPEIENILGEKLGNIAATDYAAQLEEALASIPEAFNGVLEIIGINKEMMLEKLSEAELSGAGIVESVMTSVVNPLGTALVGFVLTTVVAMTLIIVIKIVAALADKAIKKLPVIKSCNSLLGGVFGVLRGVISVVVISMLLSVAASFIKNPELITSVNNSFIVETVSGFIASVSGLNF